MHLDPRAANAAADAVTSLLDGGTLHLLDAAGVTLVSLPFAWPAFEPAEYGCAKAHPLAEALAVADGEAVAFQARGPDGGLVLSGTVGTADADLILDRTAIVAGASVSVAGISYRQGVQS